MRGWWGEASSSMDTAHSQRTKSTTGQTQQYTRGLVSNGQTVVTWGFCSGHRGVKYIPIAFPSSLVDPVKILEDKFQTSKNKIRFGSLSFKFQTLRKGRKETFQVWYLHFKINDEASGAQNWFTTWAENRNAYTDRESDTSKGGGESKHNSTWRHSRQREWQSENPQKAALL